MNRLMQRGLAALAATTVVVGAWVTEASAHVTIDTLGTVEQGSFAKLGFSVPNERDDAGTVSIKVQMPRDHPLVFVSVQPKEGWEVTTETRTLGTPVEAFGSSFSEVVDTITWTATGDVAVQAGQFDWFWVSAGAMPTDVDSLSFPTIQTYSSGEEVAWIEPMNADGSEPERPAPTVALVAASGGGEHGGSAASTTDDGDSNTLAVVALIVGGLGLVVGIGGIAMARRKPAAAA